MTASNRTGRRKRAALRTRKTARQGSRPTRRAGRRAAVLSTSPAADRAPEAAASHGAGWQLVRVEPGSAVAAAEPAFEPASSVANAAALGYLASGIAHALQARLGLMETIAEGLDATVASDDWEVRRSLGNLRRCLLRSHALVDQLLRTGGRASPRLVVQ